MSGFGNGQYLFIEIAEYVMQANSTHENPSDSCFRWPSIFFFFTSQSMISIFTAPVVTTKLTVCMDDERAHAEGWGVGQTRLMA